MFTMSFWFITGREAESLQTGKEKRTEAKSWRCWSWRTGYGPRYGIANGILWIRNEQKVTCSLRNIVIYVTNLYILFRIKPSQLCLGRKHAIKHGFFSTKIIQITGRTSQACVHTWPINCAVIGSHGNVLLLSST